MLLFFPTILSWLLTKLVEVSHGLTRQWEWYHVCLAVRHYPRKHHKKKKVRQPNKIEDQAHKRRFLMLTYLLPLTFIAFKVGCCIEYSMRRLREALTIKRLPNIIVFAAATNLPCQAPKIHFDTDSFIIGVNTGALVTMGNSPDQFEDLKLHNDKNDT